MSAKRKIRVEVGNLRATIYRWTHPGTGRKAWRFAWREHEGAPWKYTTRPTQADAEEEAEKTLKRLQSGALDFEALPPERRQFLAAIHAAVSVADQATVLANLQQRHESVQVSVAVARFLSFKLTAKGGASAHLEQMGRDLTALGNHFSGHTVADVQLAPLADWWDTRAANAGRHRKQGIRRTIVSFFLWAKREGLTGPAATTVAERLPSLETGGGGLYVFTPEEMAVLLHSVSREFLPWVIFGGFAGMRPEEIAPKVPKATKKRPAPPKPKPGLCWEHIDWTFKVIRLPAEISKVRRARVIPLHPVILQWFAHIGADTTWKGRVCIQDAATAGETKRLGLILDQQFNRATGWPSDALRHSYGTFRNAVLRNLSQVAEEMGTSETMLHRHYHNPKSAEEGAAWFSLDFAESSDKFRSLQKSGVEPGQQMTA